MNLRDHPNDITYWAIATQDGYGGYTFPAPVVVKGRWEEKQELFRDAKGDEAMSQAIVYVDTDVVLRGYLAEGDQTATADPTQLPGQAYEIKQYLKIPDLRGNEVERKAIL